MEKEDGVVDAFLGNPSDEDNADESLSDSYQSTHCCLGKLSAIKPQRDRVSSKSCPVNVS